MRNIKTRVTGKKLGSPTRRGRSRWWSCRLGKPTRTEVAEMATRYKTSARGSKSSGWKSLEVISLAGLPRNGIGGWDPPLAVEMYPSVWKLGSDWVIRKENYMRFDKGSVERRQFILPLIRVISPRKIKRACRAHGERISHTVIWRSRRTVVRNLVLPESRDDDTNSQ